MADLKEDKIDFGKLERELLSAVEADAHYWRENDAKLRAVDQRVESYEQFRDMVAAAHIKPLDKKDKFGQTKPSQPWNPFSASNRSSSSSSTAPSGSELTEVKHIPKNGHEFTKEWRKHKKAEGCYDYLLGLGGEVLMNIFKSEISFGLLREIITALDTQFKEEDAGMVVDILFCLSRAGRFSLSLDFLSKAEKQTLKDLVSKLERWVGNRDSTATAKVGGDREEEKEKEKDPAEGRMIALDAERNSQQECCSKDISQSDLERLNELYKVEKKC